MKALLVIVSSLLLTTPVAHAQLKIDLGGARITATGITPGGDAVCLGVAREPGETMPLLLRLERATSDDDRDGEVVFELGREIPPISLWAVVDVATGRAEIQPGTETAARPADGPSELPTSRRDGSIALADRRGYLELLIARPGVDVWTLSVGAGRQGDQDPAPDGLVIPAVARSHSLVAKTGQSGGLRGGDVVVAIDPTTFEYYSLRLAASR